KLLYKYNIHHDLPAFWLNRIPLPANYAYYPQMQRHPLKNSRALTAATQQDYGNIAASLCNLSRRESQQAVNTKMGGVLTTFSKWNS
ncbi:MAG: hypothetical protein E7G83_24690, partial [Klebsiella aerogenes]|nr:hypothetical protein [Klebsiella aerogenes]